eukprot:363294-Chlamydomonas_euryale.AAC.3
MQPGIPPPPPGHPVHPRMHASTQAQTRHRLAHDSSHPCAHPARLPAGFRVLEMRPQRPVHLEANPISQPFNNQSQSQSRRYRGWCVTVSSHTQRERTHYEHARVKQSNRSQGSEVSLPEWSKATDPKTVRYPCTSEAKQPIPKQGGIPARVKQSNRSQSSEVSLPSPTHQNKCLPSSLLPGPCDAPTAGSERRRRGRAARASGAARQPARRSAAGGGAAGHARVL